MSRPVKQNRLPAKRFATSKGIDYLDEPCMFECGMNVDREEHLTIEESIDNNSWAEDDHEAQFFIQQKHEECKDCDEQKRKLKERNAEALLENVRRNNANNLRK